MTLRGSKVAPTAGRRDRMPDQRVPKTARQP